MRYTPTFQLPALDQDPLAKDIPGQSWDLALALESVLARNGYPPVGSDLLNLVRRVTAVEAAAGAHTIGSWVNVTTWAGGFAGHPNESQWGKVQYRTIGPAGAPNYLDLRGEIAAPASYAADAVMFTLPTAARPTQALQVLVLDNASATPGIAMVNIRTDGTVRLAPAGKSFINLTLTVPLR